MSPPRRDGEGRCLPIRRGNGPKPDYRRHGHPQRRPATTAIRSRIPYQVVRLQERAAVVANLAADIAWASDYRLWAEAGSHLLSTTCSLWLAAEALAEWGGERMKASLLDMALRYAAKGIPVFPLAAGTKVPTKGSHGHLDATKRETLVRARWELYPDANIGIATGAK
jgi:Bifunctional DNA primase/polymerase, N-terminal